MFNNHQYNTTLYNALKTPQPESEQDAIVFNDYGLQNDSVVTSLLTQDSTPDRDLDTEARPRDDGQFIIGDFWRKKTISMRGYIRKDTDVLLDAELDKMKKALSKREGILDIKIPINDGVIRRYRGTLINGQSLFSDRKGYHITLCPYEAQFLVIDPFGYEINYGGAVYYNRPELVFEEQVNNVGTVRARPVIIFNFSAADNVTKISFKNTTTGEEIELTANISAGDYVKFDTETLRVTVNGVKKDYLGNFPRLDTDSNKFIVTITGNSALYTLTVKHKIPYL